MMRERVCAVCGTIFPILGLLLAAHAILFSGGGWE